MNKSSLYFAKTKRAVAGLGKLCGAED